MKANLSDWLVIKGTTTERSDQRGRITEVHSADGPPPTWCGGLRPAMWRRWFPALTPLRDTKEQEAADERAQRAAHRGTNH